MKVGSPPPVAFWPIHTETAQSIGHCWGLQFSVSSTSVLHAAPPPEATVVTVLVRRRSPVPHGLSHRSQACQPDSTQSTGQAWSLQKRASVIGAHATPPYAAGVVMLRRRDWRPLPQSCVQVVQLPQAPSSQSIGQSWVLQFSVAEVISHWTPSVVGLSMMLRVRWRVPVPQVCVQASQSDQAPRRQSTGQLAAPQASCSTRLPHSWPLCWSAVMMERVWYWTPPPQVLVQAVSADHSDVSQSIGHGPSLHWRVSFFG